MLTYDMEARGALPRYEYIYRCIRRDILSGELASGEKLPGKRALAEHLGVSVVTVDAACVAATSPEMQEKTFDVMGSLQIRVANRT